MFEALDGEAAAALIATAEDWLREQGMTRALGPISLSIWDEPGLEIEGFDEPPTAMMGHHQPGISQAGSRMPATRRPRTSSPTKWTSPIGTTR